MRRAVVSVLALTCLLVAAPSALAAEAPAANYLSGGLEFAAGSPIINCRGWSGGADDNGHSYVPCPGPQFPYVYEFDETGTYLRYAQLPASYLFDATYRMRDVGVSPDGNTMFVSVGPIVDDLGINIERPGGSVAGAILRFTRQPGGSWAHDVGFRAGPFLLGQHYWAPRFLDVDAKGHVYTTANGYVYELDGATGAVLGTFGGVTTAGPGGKWLEGTDVPVGIAVANDGASMLLVEQRHNLLQRWVRDPVAGWKRDTTWGPNGNGLIGEPSVIDASHCTRNDRFQSPYDVATDVAGDIYVTDVSCHRIQRYTAAGAFVQTVWSNGYADAMVHGMIVNTFGSVFIPELERRLMRTDPAVKPPEAKPAPPPCVDAAAPTIATTGLPARSATRRVAVTLTGTDDCSSIVALRVTGAVTGATDWVDGATTSVDLSGWNGTKALTIEARDAAGNVATRRTRTTLALPQPRLVSRTNVALRTKGCAPGNPLSRVAGARSYRVVSRCARLTGTTMSARRVGRTWRVELQLSTPVAQKLYANAVGPVKIWIVTDARTRVVRAPKVGRGAVVVGPLVALRTLRGTFAIPVTSLRG